MTDRGVLVAQQHRTSLLLRFVGCADLNEFRFGGDRL